jgi:hypothetical protein
VGDVGVGEQRDVGDAVAFDEEILLSEMVLHDFERGQAAVAFGGERRGALGGVGTMLQQKARSSDEWLQEQSPSVFFPHRGDQASIYYERNDGGEDH